MHDFHPMSNRLKLIGCLMLCGVPSKIFAVGASGFTTQLVSAKALGQGNAFVSEADNPSALYFNPAGLTQLKKMEIMTGFTALVPMVDHQGADVPDDAMRRRLAVIPNFYITHPLPSLADHALSAGLSLTSPYGITTEWAPTSSVRYVTTKADFEMVNVNPAVAYDVGDALSFGAGVDYVRLMDTTARSQMDLALANGDSSADGTSTLSGHGQGWGYNVGALYRPWSRHSFGIAYRSQVRIPVRGNIELSHLSNSTQANYGFDGPSYSADATTSIILPATAIVGYAFKPTPRWTLLADYEWTQWNTLQSEDIALNEQNPSRLALLTGNPNSNVVSISRHWHNVSAVGVGANYKPTAAWEWRGGYGFFEKTSPNDTASPDIPDAPIHLLTAGCSRHWTSWTVDAAFNAYFYIPRDVSNTVGNTVGGSVNGTYKTFVPSLVLDVTYTFDTL